jgi:hypothetical protein
LVALHFDQVRQFVERWCRRITMGAVAMAIVATLWYLVAVWTGSGTGRASNIYQPIAFLWFTAAVAALEAGTWWWYRRTVSDGRRPRYSPYLAGLTGGIFLSHVLAISLLRSALGATGLGPHLGWAGTVVVLYVVALSISGVFTALVLRTPLRWVIGGPVRAEQRARLDELAAARAGPDPASPIAGPVEGERADLAAPT